VKKKRLFGTDGVRGLANQEITPKLALELAQAAGLTLSSKNSYKRALVGRDTRLSGEMLLQAINSGISSAGVDVVDVGIITTPGVAYLTSKLNVDFGVIISASHNAYYDNGIKFVNHQGFKLPDATEDKIADKMNHLNLPIKDKIGHITQSRRSGVDNYIEYLTSIIHNKFASDPKRAQKPFHGLKIVLDPGNGAAFYIAPKVLRELGAEVITINDSPTGTNINLDSGSTHPETMCLLTKTSKSDLGIAYDGDADRCIACDKNGNLVNGDQIMGILAQAKKNNGTLNQDTLVLTVMSNLGLLQSLEKIGINYVTTGVGDRYVLEEMQKSGFNLGGEQSGHIINLDYSTTGDGILSSLLLAEQIIKQKKSLKELAAQFPQFPQVLINIPNVDKQGLAENKVIKQKIKDVEKVLGSDGRVLIRPSGTEPLIRVMVEAKTQEQAKSIADILSKTIKKELGLKKVSK